VLQDAAVLGKTFTKRALAALSGSPTTRSSPCSRRSCARRCSESRPDPRSPEHGQYGFLQDLVRHVAYETLSKRERHARHLAAAAHLEASFSDEEEIVEVLASHYLDAYRELPDAEDSGEIKAKAREMLSAPGSGRVARRGTRGAALLPAGCRADGRAARSRRARREGGPDGVASRASEEAIALLGEALAVLEPEGSSAGGADRRRPGGDRLPRGRRTRRLNVWNGRSRPRRYEPDAVVAETARQLGRFLMLTAVSTEARRGSSLHSNWRRRCAAGDPRRRPDE
jgi:hypothetical protein